MSWEYNEYKKECPCGKGLILVRDGSNDWGQTSHDESILCDECRENDERNKNLKQERRRIANDKIVLVMKYFRENYYNLLKGKFLHTKSKRDVWVVASNLGIESYSLTSFYKHYRSKDSYVSDLINWYRIVPIIKALEIEDKTLNELYEDAAIHIKEFDDKQAAQSYLYYKGR